MQGAFKILAFPALCLIDQKLDLGNGIRVGMTAVLCRVKIDLAAWTDDAITVGIHPLANGAIYFVDRDEEVIVDGASHRR